MAQATHCKAPRCKRAIRAKRYCERHYRAWRRGELPKPRYKRCKAENCRKPMAARGYCGEHFDRWKAGRKRVVRLSEKAKAKEPPAAPAAPPEAAASPAAQ